MILAITFRVENIFLTFESGNIFLAPKYFPNLQGPNWYQPADIHNFRGRLTFIKYIYIQDQRGLLWEYVRKILELVGAVEQEVVRDLDQVGEREVDRLSLTISKAKNKWLLLDQWVKHCAECIYKSDFFISAFVKLFVQWMLITN